MNSNPRQAAPHGSNGVRPPFVGPTPAVVASRYLKLPVHRRRVLVAARSTG